MGPPLGEQAYDRDGVVVDFWLGSTCWRRLDPARWARIEQVLTAGQPDPAGASQDRLGAGGLLVPGLPALLLPRRLAEDGRLDGPFYDYTDGVCPAGHHHMIDD